MKTQTLKITDLSPAPGVSYFTGSQVDYDAKKDRIQVLGLVAGGVARDTVTGDVGAALGGVLHVDRQDPAGIIFGTSIYKRLVAYPEDNGIVVPFGVFVPCDFELAFPNYLGVVGEYTLPASGTAVYGIDVYLTLYYEEINAVSRRRR